MDEASRTDPDGLLDDAASTDVDARVFAMRESGASWLDIQRSFGLSRQQARYSYQRAKREARRAEKRQGA